MKPSRFPLTAPPSETTASSPSLPLLWRILLLVAGALLMLISIAQFLSWRQTRNELVALTEEARLGDGGDLVRLRLEREGITAHGRLIAARALVYEVLEGTREDSVSEQDFVRLQSSRLQNARRLAEAALADQPGSWQASMFLGASTYLEWALTRDRRLFTDSEVWHEPLLRAIGLAPGKAEPRRFLAAAYLEVWPNLTGERKERARKLLSDTFRDDPPSFAQLFPVWLEVARDLDEAFEPLPERPSAWHSVARRYATLGRWTAFRRAHLRYRESMKTDLQRRLDEAERRLELGDLYDGRSTLLRVIVESPIDREFAPLVARALARYPPGLHGLRSTRALEGWLEWAFELDALGQRGLPPLVVSRMAGVTDDLAPEKAALAALIGGEIHQAEQLERLAETFSTDAWAPYLIAKSRWHLERGEAEAAAATLALVGEDSKGRLASYALAEERVAEARGDAARLTRARQQLDELRAQRISAQSWRWRNQRASVLLLPETAASGLTLELIRVPEEGAVVEIRWDGAVVALQPVYPASPSPGARLNLPLEITPVLHRLEFQTLAGRTVQPGGVRLGGPAR